MPSKRKKNKRRMRRVQAQRRALEEQYASSGKGTPGVCAVSAPVPARVAKLPKTSECRVSVPIPLALVAPVDVPAEDPPVEPVVLEVPVTDAVKDEVVKAAEDLGQSLVEPPAEEPAVIEDESVTVPLSEAISSVDEPVSIPAESEIQFEDTTSVATEDIRAEPEPEEFPVEAAVPTDALVEPEPEQQQQQQQTVPLEEPTPSVESTSDPIAEEFVVNESVVAVETTVKEEQIPETTTDAPEVPSEALAETIPAPEPLPLPVPVPVVKEIIQAQDEFMAQVETETIKDLAVTGGLTVDAINGCLGATEVAIEG
ncbi:cell surface glycoprotein 1 isoform X3 [Megalobrama amblycephala]|uniref:cell surface glycoprotein 1 isoform X3 n=1 Tax=Megalobrama amblycephala TaxID=75352 RepID=UPI0020140238|nr:cell surface glycoprotein 1 isoform X3 [Megalobrama amblycephala]